VLSIEPGFYEAETSGIRIENLFEIVERPTGFLGFQTLSYMPIGTKPLIIDQLSATETSWLNQYHADVYDRLQAQVDDNARSYLRTATQAI
jgi:Xaa-Pro aminopeptidase